MAGTGTIRRINGSLNGNNMSKLGEYLKVAPVFSYFVRVFKKDSEGKYPKSANLKMMHGINKVSIVMFGICVLVLIYRFFFRSE